MATSSAAACDEELVQMKAPVVLLYKLRSRGRGQCRGETRQQLGDEASTTTIVGMVVQAKADSRHLFGIAIVQ